MIKRRIKLMTKLAEGSMIQIINDSDSMLRDDALNNIFGSETLPRAIRANGVRYWQHELFCLLLASIELVTVARTRA